MITITNGRIKHKNEFGTSINCFLVEEDGEIPIYQLEDGSKFQVVDKESFPAIQGENFKTGGAWTNYNITVSKPTIFKFHIAHRSTDVDTSGQFYFGAIPLKEGEVSKYVHSFTTVIVDKKGDVFKDKVSNVIMGNVVFLPEKTLNKRGINYNKTLCNIGRFKEMISYVKFTKENA